VVEDAINCGRTWAVVVVAAALFSRGRAVMDNVDDAFNELMGNYQSEVPGLEAQIAADLAEARKRANGGLDLEPIFANLEALMHRCTRIEKAALALEQRVMELEARQKEENLNG
jgi:hypothetical protein